jgi:branched-chain amino acid transport system substrate-binding protein
VKPKQLYPLALAVSFATSVAAQDVTIGVTMGTTGASASFGISYKNAFQLMGNTLGGQPAKFIIYEDNADAEIAANNARKLIAEDNVDALCRSSPQLRLPRSPTS